MFSGKLYSARTLDAASATCDQDATRRAFALVTLSHPRLSYDGWVRFLRRATRRKTGRTGMIFLEDPRGYPHALFRFAVDGDPSLVAAADGSRRTLRLSDLVIADLAGASLLSLVAEHGEKLARALGCQLVAIELPSGLRDSGGDLNDYQRVAGGVLSKALRPELS